MEVVEEEEEENAEEANGLLLPFELAGNLDDTEKGSPLLLVVGMTALGGRRSGNKAEVLVFEEEFEFEFRFSFVPLVLISPGSSLTSDAAIDVDVVVVDIIIVDVDIIIIIIIASSSALSSECADVDKKLGGVTSGEGGCNVVVIVVVGIFFSTAR